MKTSVQPMEIQSKFMREDLRQYEIPARGGQLRSIIVVKVNCRFKPPASSEAQEPIDRCRLRSKDRSTTPDRAVARKQPARP